MATRAATAARNAVAAQSAEQSIQSIAAGLGLEVPPQPSGPYARDPAHRAALQTERYATFLKAVAGKVGKPVEDEPQQQGPVEAPAPEGEPPHTQAVTPLPTQQAEEPDGDGEQPEGADEPHFAGKPLSAYDDVPDDQLTEQDGVGEATAKKIVRARKRRDARKS